MNAYISVRSKVAFSFMTRALDKLNDLHIIHNYILSKCRAFPLFLYSVAVVLGWSYTHINMLFYWSDALLVCSSVSRTPTLTHTHTHTHTSSLYEWSTFLVLLFVFWADATRIGLNKHQILTKETSCPAIHVIINATIIYYTIILFTSVVVPSTRHTHTHYW